MHANFLELFKSEHHKRSCIASKYLPKITKFIDKNSNLSSHPIWDQCKSLFSRRDQLPPWKYFQSKEELQKDLVKADYQNACRETIELKIRHFLGKSTNWVFLPPDKTGTHVEGKEYRSLHLIFPTKFPNAQY